MGIKTEHVMQKRAAVKPDSTVREIAYKLMYTGYPGLPVVDENMHVLGIVTELDLLKIMRDGRDVDAVKAESFMTKQPKTASPDSRVNELMDMMISNNFTLIPIVKNGKLMGVVSRNSVMETFVEPGVWTYYNE